MLLRILLRETHRAENECVFRCAREADRLEGSPPAQALLDIAHHASATLCDLCELAPDARSPRSRIVRAIGGVEALARTLIVDRFSRAERHYRVTLLRVREGIDLVDLLSETAAGLGRTDLVQFCAHWEQIREPQWRKAVDGLVWFAARPGVALSRGRNGDDVERVPVEAG